MVARRTMPIWLFGSKRPVDGFKMTAGLIPRSYLSDLSTCRSWRSVVQRVRFVVSGFGVWAPASYCQMPRNRRGPIPQTLRGAGVVHGARVMLCVGSRVRSGSRHSIAWPAGHATWWDIVAKQTAHPTVCASAERRRLVSPTRTQSRYTHVSARYRSEGSPGTAVLQGPHGVAAASNSGSAALRVRATRHEPGPGRGHMSCSASQGHLRTWGDPRPLATHKRTADSAGRVRSCRNGRRSVANLGGRVAEKKMKTGAATKGVVGSSNPTAQEMPVLCKSRFR